MGSGNCYLCHVRLHAPLATPTKAETSPEPRQDHHTFSQGMKTEILQCCSNFCWSQTEAELATVGSHAEPCAQKSSKSFPVGRGKNKGHQQRSRDGDRKAPEKRTNTPAVRDVKDFWFLVHGSHLLWTRATFPALGSWERSWSLKSIILFLPSLQPWNVPLSNGRSWHCMRKVGQNCYC